MRQSWTSVIVGTFAGETDAEPARYGIVKNIDTYNPIRIASHRIAFHEWTAIVRDLVGARSMIHEGREAAFSRMRAEG